GEKVTFKIKGSAPDKDLVVRARYIPPTGHDAGGPALPDDVAKLITAKQCLACHQVETNSVGPAYLNVALRYRDEKNALASLQQKLKNGGAGVWGEIPMPPQAAVSEAESQQIIRAILGLAEGITEVRGQREGTLTLPPAPANAAPGGAWELTAQAPQCSFAKTRINAK
ncbi:MAG: hypothetical protein RI957_714, partial [Verrucomicrobiota bacterium]